MPTNKDKPQTTIYNVKCPYCHTQAKLSYGSEVWINRPALKDKLVYTCETCDARVGTHEDGRPLGTMARASLRRLRIRTHKQIDALWQLNFMGRKEMYTALAFHMQIPFKFAHIGLFTEQQCLKARHWAKQKLQEKQ